CAGRVVLGQARDRVEELRAPVVVEVLGRKLLRRGSETGANVGREGALVVVRIDVHVDADSALGGLGHMDSTVGASPAASETTDRSGTRTQSGCSSIGSDAAQPGRANSELPTAVATTWWPSLSRQFNRPCVIFSTAWMASTSASTGGAPASRRSSVIANSTSESAAPSMPS